MKTHHFINMHAPHDSCNTVRAGIMRYDEEEVLCSSVCSNVTFGLQKPYSLLTLVSKPSVFWACFFKPV